MDDKSRRLMDDASAFESSSNQLRQTMYWKNMKAKIIIGIMAIALFMIVILLLTNN